jgi:hypothetical protein
VKQFKVFNKVLLRLANQIAIRRGYNRAIVEEYIEKQPEDAAWAVVFHMPHEHAAGKPVATHMRCMLQQLFVPNPPTLFVDTDWDLFNEVPAVEIGETTEDTPKPQEV